MKLSKHYSDKSTKVLGLGNLFDMNEVRSSGDPDFYKNLKEEVKEECQKYGTVRDMKIDKKKVISQVFHLMVCEDPHVRYFFSFKGRGEG